MNKFDGALWGAFVTFLLLGFGSGFLVGAVLEHRQSAQWCLHGIRSTP